MTPSFLHTGFKYCLLPCLLCCISVAVHAQTDAGLDTLIRKDSLVIVDSAIVIDSANAATENLEALTSKKTYFGTASFYSNKFQGRKTANGEIFTQKKLTAACNVLPLGTLIRVTNIKNGKVVIVRVNDRLHPKMKRLVDLTRLAAVKLDFIGKGLTRVKVEVLKYPEKKKRR